MFRGCSMFWPKLEDPVLGTLWRCCGTWEGSVSLQDVPQKTDIIIEIPKEDDPQLFLKRVRKVVEEFRQFRADFAQQLFEDYCFYKRMDIEEGGFTEADYTHYP